MSNILLWDLGTRRAEHNEPLGIEMLAGALRQEMPNCKIELRWENLQSRDQHPDLHVYNIVGLSVKPGALPLVTSIVNTIRRLPHSPTVVLGDALPTYAYKELLVLFPEAICVLGEGESSIGCLARQSVRNGQLSPAVLQNIPNLAFIHNGRLRVTHRFQENPDNLPSPDRRFLDQVIRRQGIIRIEASRGCVYSHCQFCCVKSKYGSGKWRPFPISSVLSELAMISSNGGISPYFCDEDFFGGNHGRSIDLASAIIEAKRKKYLQKDLTFFVSARANDLVGPQAHRALYMLKCAGLREVFIGIESGSSVQLSRYGKHATPDLNRLALSALQTVGLQSDVGYILFEPEMSFEELRLNAQYLYTLDLVEHDARSIKDMRVQPLTGLADKYSRQGMITGSLDLNTLRYPTKYNDERVAWVRQTFQEFEANGLEKVYALQASSRGEVQSTEYRNSAKRQLGKLRKNDLEQLFVYIAYAGGEISTARMKQLTNEHKQTRINLIDSILCDSNDPSLGQEVLPSRALVCQ